MAALTYTVCAEDALGAIAVCYGTTWQHLVVNLAETEEIKLNHPMILTHNPLKGTPSTVAALPVIIEFLKAHGYTFVALY